MCFVYIEVPFNQLGKSLELDFKMTLDMGYIPVVPLTQKAEAGRGPELTTVRPLWFT